MSRHCMSNTSSACSSKLGAATDLRQSHVKERLFDICAPKYDLLVVCTVRPFGACVDGGYARSLGRHGDCRRDLVEGVSDWSQTVCRRGWNGEVIAAAEWVISP